MIAKVMGGDPLCIYNRELRFVGVEHVRRLPASLTLPVLIVFAPSACGSGQPSDESSTPSADAQVQTLAAAGQPQASAAAEKDCSLHTELALVDEPSVTADGKNVAVTVTVKNDGIDAFGSAPQPHNVNLGAHAVEADGKIIVNDLSRALLPQIAAGASGRATILLPITKLIGYRAQILPVEEGVGWFSDWGTKPLVVGPFMACSSAGTGSICDASGKALPAATVNN